MNKRERKRKTWKKQREKMEGKSCCLIHANGINKKIGANNLFKFSIFPDRDLKYLCDDSGICPSCPSI